jgi:very-short-patch-repair endonuclease
MNTNPNPLFEKRMRYADARKKHMTPEETLLWNHFLKKHPGRFHRLTWIEGCFAEFYSPSLKIVIEINAKKHDYRRGSTPAAKRTRSFGKKGIAVIHLPKNALKAESFARLCGALNAKLRGRETDIKRAMSEANRFRKATSQKKTVLRA